VHAESAAALGFALAATLAIGVTPLAARAAARTGFLDHPAGYKKHGHATPYLGGTAVLFAFLVPALLWGGLSDRFLAVALGAAALWIVGTIDDRFNLSPYLRVAVEALAAVGLWAGDLGWTLSSSDLLNLALTMIWVIGVVNAFNLMDNLDGATGTVTLAVGVGIGAFALQYGDDELAAFAWALAGACAGFLRYNLARPSRIFLGDGGSMPIGFLAAAGAIAATSTSDLDLGYGALLCAGLVVGLVILDTTLVVISRRRRGISLLTGGRDHLTHRLLAMTGSARTVAATLGVLQLALCTIALVAATSGRQAVSWAAAGTVVVGIVVITVLEIRYSVPPAAAVSVRSGE
jgi:UDP-GlcNAc:undecaprenyl-phosphate/decaprenyl-phosphate GlcNAc-1-phosphate transferase